MRVNRTADNTVRLMILIPLREPGLLHSKNDTACLLSSEVVSIDKVRRVLALLVDVKAVED